MFPGINVVLAVIAIVCVWAMLRPGGSSAKMFWVTDGSKNISLGTTTVVCNGGNGNTHNAMWKQPMVGDEVFWEFTFHEVEGGAFVGLTNEDKFAPGYKIRGAFYGGNLADGSSLLATDFGPRFSAGDKVGMVISREGPDTAIYFLHNNIPLGLGYKFPSEDLPNPYPAVIFHESGVVSISANEEILSQRKIRNREAVFKGEEGDWRMYSIIGRAAQFRPILTIRRRNTDSNSFDALAKIINIVKFTVVRVGENVSAVGGVSTMMAGSSSMMKFESDLTKHFLNPTEFYEDGGTLVYIGNEITTLWHRYDDSPQGFEGSPFNSPPSTESNNDSPSENPSSTNYGSPIQNLKSSQARQYSA